MKAATYWRCTIPQMLPHLGITGRAQQKKVAYEVSMNIIPYQRMRAELLPQLLKKPHDTKSIPLDTLADEYGVDRRYVCTAYLRAYDEYLTNHPDVSAKLHRFSSATNNSAHLAIVTALVCRGGMDREYIGWLITTFGLTATLGPYAPEQVERIAQEQDMKQRRLLARQTRKVKFDLTQSWAGWKERRRITVANRAAIATNAVIEAQTAPTSSPTTSPLKALAMAIAPFSHPGSPKPSLAATMLYAVKHVIPRLIDRGYADIAGTMVLQGEAYGRQLPAKRHNERVLISLLTGSEFERPTSDTDPAILRMANEAKAYRMEKIGVLPEEMAPSN